jgi:hypothetical protein
MSRKSIGDETINQLDESPLDLLVNGSPTMASKTKNQPPNTAKKKTKEDKIDLPAGKERMTVQINKDILEGVKDIVYWERTTVAQFVEKALEAALINFEKKNGEPYPKRKAQLKPGRPMK